MMLGVALAFAVHLINASALNEFAHAVRSVSGQADLSLGAGGSARFNASLYGRLSRHPDVAWASPVLEINTYALASVARDAAAPHKVALRVIGVDALQLLAISPDLIPLPDARADRLDVFAPKTVFLNASAQAALGQPASQPAAPANETAELNRILKLSGMELIAEGSTKSITVQRGDTLGKIAADNSTTVAALAKLNNISNPDRIYPGDVIRLPGDVIRLPGGMAKRQGSTQIPDRAEKLTTTTSTGNPKIAMEYFLDQGWTPEQAAGLVANLQAESYDQIDPAAQNGGAYGIAQWRGSRKRDFEEEMGRPLKGSSLMDQLKFVQHELNNKESNAGRLLKQATTAAHAAEIVDEFYERSGGAAIRRRIALANSLLTAFA
jgi:LysM repeat protein